MPVRLLIGCQQIHKDGATLTRGARIYSMNFSVFYLKRKKKNVLLSVSIDDLHRES